VLTPNISELGRLGKCLGVDMPGPMGAGWQVGVSGREALHTCC
jgi:hypothetical protein